MCAMHMIVSSQTNTHLIAFIRDYADFSGYSMIQQKWSFSCPQLAFLLFPGAAISSKLDSLTCLLLHFHQSCLWKRRQDIIEALNHNSLRKRRKKGKSCSLVLKVSRSCLRTSEVSKSYLNGHESFLSTLEWMLLPHTCKPFICVDALTPTGTLPILSTFPFSPPPFSTCAYPIPVTSQNWLEQNKKPLQNKYHLALFFPAFLVHF